MIIYDLSVMFAGRETALSAELLDAVREAIETSNSAFSAVRRKRRTELVGTIDDHHMHIRISSESEINPTRSMSSVSRALVKNEKSKNSNLLDGRIANGCVFRTVLLPKPRGEEIVPSRLTDSEALQILVEMAVGTKYEGIAEETLRSVKELLAQKINQTR